MKKYNNYADVKASLDEFLAKEHARLDRWDLLLKRAWLTVDKPEEQASDFARILKNLIDSATGDSWKVFYKTGPVS